MEKDKSVFLYFAGHEKYFYMLKKNLEKIILQKLLCSSGRCGANAICKWHLPRGRGDI